MCLNYFRQLTEKHQLLLRKFDREYKANKRLSMDNEELSWRLTVQEQAVLGMGGSPDLVRRQVSRSPPTTPEPSPVKPRKSPTSSSPRQSNSDQTDSRLPKSLSPKGDTNLRRSGTYDLLNKDCDNEEDLKQSDV